MAHMGGKGGGEGRKEWGGRGKEGKRGGKEKEREIEGRKQREASTINFLNFFGLVPKSPTHEVWFV
jgi:hypothetical protein